MIHDLLLQAVQNQGFQSLEHFAQVAAKPAPPSAIERLLQCKDIAPDGTLENSQIFPLLPTELQERIKQMRSESSKVSLAVSEADHLEQIVSLLLNSG
ncbi:MAG: hypothetical protein N2690_00415 [Rhodocyclaceae bacterium]|nr:hypothetical protein [Rhodocyclaceae bacterium]